MNSGLKFIISGGGTGGHIFPAVSIGKMIEKTFPNSDILFVGAEGRMEMEKVPANGFKIVGLPIAGLQRSLTLKNFLFPFKLFKSLRRARKIVKDFKPDIVIGVGGYASFPVLRSASKLRIPTLLQEQNSYAGLTNKILGKKADSICVAYEKMDKYFPKNKIKLTGNPVRENILIDNSEKKDAYEYFGLNSEMQTVLIVGGSLGARTLNDSGIEWIDELCKNQRVQFLWQTGKLYFNKVKSAVESKNCKNIKVVEFIKRMDYAYGISDTIVSRAGAGTISELCIVGKPVILVPSPNVAEDHQTKNAMALVQKGAALMVKDENARSELFVEVFNLLGDEKQKENLSKEIKLLEKPEATKDIVEEIKKILGLDD